MGEKIVIEAAALLFGSGLAALLWKTSWALRGFADAQEKRAATEQEIVIALREFIGAQRETNERLSITTRVLARDIRQLQKHVFEIGQDQLDPA